VDFPGLDGHGWLSASGWRISEAAGPGRLALEVGAENPRIELVVGDGELAPA
jgi:hypothetical protein